MQYWKMTYNDGFVSVSTINAEGDGNSTKAEHDTVAELLRNAPAGSGVVETESGFAYAPFPVDPDPELDDSAALEILMGGAT